MFYTRNAKSGIQFKDDEKDQYFQVDPDFQPLHLYEIDEDSDLFESDQYESCSSSEKSREKKENNLQEILEDEQESSSSSHGSENDTEKGGKLQPPRKSTASK